MTEQNVAVPSATDSTSSKAPAKDERSKPIICRLCRGPPVQLTYLNCKHTFCYICLHAYVEREQYTDSLDFPCPHCSKRSAPPWGTWHLSHKVADRSHDELYQTWKYEAMCDNCASEGLYATAGRHCSECNIHLCDTCAFAHSVMIDTQTHSITTQMSKMGHEAKAMSENKDVKTGKYMDGSRYISSM